MAPGSPEKGAALIVVLMAITVAMTLGAALILITSTEALIARNFQGGREAFYAAEAIGELVIAELRSGADWDAILDGRQASRFVDGAAGGVRALPTDSPVDVTTIVNVANCGIPAPCAGNARWQLFAYGPLRDFLPDAHDSPFYVAALVAPPAAGAGSPELRLRAEAFGPMHAHRAIEVTLARTGIGGAVVERMVFAQD